MAAAIFSRDVLEQNQTDLIDFETIIETPQTDLIVFETPQQKVKKAQRIINITDEFEKYLEETQGVPLFLREIKIYNHCDWLKIGKKERCGKRCKQFYCSTHSKYINIGGEIPLPCITCGVGVRMINQLCTRCELEICNKRNIESTNQLLKQCER